MSHKVIFNIFLTTFVASVSTDECFTPNGEKAQCVSLYSCPTLIAAIATQNPISQEFVRRSHCGYKIDPYVCCGKAGNFTMPTEQAKTDKPQTDPNPMDLLPTKRYCGYQHADDYFRSENDAKTSTINEFPWLALLKFDQLSKADDGFRCVGSLISDRYVLTAAHCLNQPHLKLIGVRLGEYNIQRERDCVDEGSDLEECSDPTADFGVEELFIHSGYDTKTLEHDIALVRLNKSVGYSDYVRPICLPFNGTHLAESGEAVMLSGWGRVSYDGEPAKIKKKVGAELLSRAQCENHYQTVLSYVGFKLAKGMVCTKPDASNKEATCTGDSGGPIMFSHRNQWHQEGVVSFGPRCGADAVDVCTRVADYLNWILYLIRA